MVSVMAIILQESLRAVFYAPFYVALARDAFTAEGSYAPYYAPPLVLLLAVLHDRVGKRWPQARFASTVALFAVAIGLAAYAQGALYPHQNATVHTERGSFKTPAAAAPPLPAPAGKRIQRKLLPNPPRPPRRRHSPACARSSTAESAAALPSRRSRRCPGSTAGSPGR